MQPPAVNVQVFCALPPCCARWRLPKCWSCNTLPVRKVLIYWLRPRAFTSWSDIDLPSWLGLARLGSAIHDCAVEPQKDVASPWRAYRVPAMTMGGQHHRPAWYVAAVSGMVKNVCATYQNVWRLLHVASACAAPDLSSSSPRKR